MLCLLRRRKSNVQHQSTVWKQMITNKLRMFEKLHTEAATAAAAATTAASPTTTLSAASQYNISNDISINKTRWHRERAWRILMLHVQYLYSYMMLGCTQYSYESNTQTRTKNITRSVFDSFVPLPLWHVCSVCRWACLNTETKSKALLLLINMLLTTKLNALWSYWIR